MKINNLNVTSLEVTRELCKRSLYHFFLEFWDEIVSEPLVDNWHIKYLCDEIQEVALRAARSETKLYDYVIINIAPGLSKSTIVTIMLPAWLWTIRPSMRIMSASYSGTLALDHSVKSRDIINSEKYKRLFGVQLRKDQSGKGYYKNTANGDRYATSVGGTVTGFHANILIVDDPLNPKEASSDAERETANRFMSETLSTRKVNKAVVPTILIMQRLHENDCTGFILNNAKEQGGIKVKHICLPSEISEDLRPLECKKYYVNGLLDYKRMPIEVLNEMKMSLGSYGYAGQMMQAPAPKGGGIWKRWFKFSFI
jgi:hypothetical protein